MQATIVRTDGDRGKFGQCLGDGPFRPSNEGLLTKKPGTHHLKISYVS